MVGSIRTSNLVQTKSRAGHQGILSALKQDPRVAFEEEDQIVYTFRHLTRKLPWQPQQPPSQPTRILPNGVNRIDGDLSFTIAGNNKGSVSADIAVLDSGIDLKHPEAFIDKRHSSPVLHRLMTTMAMEHMLEEPQPPSITR